MINFTIRQGCFGKGVFDKGIAVRTLRATSLQSNKCQQSPQNLVQYQPSFVPINQPLQNIAIGWIWNRLGMFVSMTTLSEMKNLFI